MDNSNNNPFLASNQFNNSGQAPANFGANNPSGNNPFIQNNPASSMNNTAPVNPVASEAPVASANSGDIYQNLYRAHSLLACQPLTLLTKIMPT